MRWTLHFHHGNDETTTVSAAEEGTPIEIPNGIVATAVTIEPVPEPAVGPTAGSPSEPDLTQSPPEAPETPSPGSSPSGGAESAA